ncbi:hypothetical protein T492DRAFT_851192 [Pavlovales sp. CCMP2436]|nr:hypothetical protein T492DRAFT_851192 [Pavlovales sp. CCMP2436]
MRIRGQRGSLGSGTPGSRIEERGSLGCGTPGFHARELGLWNAWLSRKGAWVVERLAFTYRKARELGLWNAWLSPELGRLAAKVCGGNAPFLCRLAANVCGGNAPGLGLSTLEYAPLAELTGRSGLLAPEALNCSGNEKKKKKKKR